MKEVYKTELIEQYIKENKISKTEFCKRAKITPYILKKIYNHKTNIGIRFIAKIAWTLNVSFSEFVY